MRRWFLSYNAQDVLLMQGLESALRRKDPGANIFFAPKKLRAGGYWQTALANGIADSNVFVLLVGKNSLGPWQVIEYNEAFVRRVREPGYPVVLILLQDQTAPGLPFLHQLHWIITPDPSSEDTVGKLLEAAGGSDVKQHELWRYTAPYRGLAAMTESDCDFFFGRAQETFDVINALATTPDKMPILLGNSGVGKSSLAQAGVIGAMLRQSLPDHAVEAGAWPTAFSDSRHWCYLTLRPGTEPLRALVEQFLRVWQFEATDPKREKRLNDWIASLQSGEATLRGLLDATQARLHELNQTKPPAFFLYVDQGEELYVRAPESQRARFSEVLAGGLADPRLRAMMSLRADFFGALQNDEALYAVHRQINVPPLREPQLRDVVSRPAQILGAQFEAEGAAADLAHRAAVESAKDSGILALLSYLLDDVWSQMVKRADGVLRLEQRTLGGVLVERAGAFVAGHPDAEDALRRLLTLKLATVRPDGEAMRRRAMRSEFDDAEWKLVSELADHPNRLLVTGTLEDGQAYAEVAHEAIFRRWDKLQKWIEQERGFLAWRSELDAALENYNNVPPQSRNDALLMGHALTKAEGWLAQHAAGLSAPARQFISDSIAQRERDRQRRRRLELALMGVLLFISCAGVAYAVWSNADFLREHAEMWADRFWPKGLSADQERSYAQTTLQPGQIISFVECTRCPEMIVVPAGKFLMGRPPNEQSPFANEDPQHEVTIPRNFAVSKYEVTFDQWQACVDARVCEEVADQGYGRHTNPVINVSWHHAQQYVKWLSERSGRPGRYRLLTEAEWEYAARAPTPSGTYARFSFGDDENQLSQFGWYIRNSDSKTHPVGEKNPNAFGIHDMLGNVWEWVEDCYHENYAQAPTDGSAWLTGDCSLRVVRGGSWLSEPQNLRVANRYRNSRDVRYSDVGFRVARTLGP
jgi:formylglycine-generating enzyme required for sulfatase activity